MRAISIAALACVLAGCIGPPATVDGAVPASGSPASVESPGEPLSTGVPAPHPPASSGGELSGASFSAFLGNLHAGGYGSIAVGQDRLLVSSHDELALFSKGGELVERRSHNRFFGGVLPPEEGLTDPRVTYDAAAGRYYVVAASGPRNGGCQPEVAECPNTWTMAVSRGASPSSLNASAWRFWSFDATIVDGTPTRLWGDFSAIAADDRILVVNGQMGTHFPTSAAFDRILVYDKGEVLEGDDPVEPLREFHHFTDPRTGEVLSGRILPAIRMDAGADGVFFVHYGLNDCDLIVGKVEGPAGAATLTLRNVEIPGTCFAWVPGEQPEDERPVHVPPIITSPPVHRNDSLWIAETVPVDHPSGRVNGVRIVQLDVSAWPAVPTVVEDHTRSEEGVHYANPALAVDEGGGIAVGFSALGRTRFLSAYEIHRASADQPWSPPAPLIEGRAPIDYPRSGDTLRFGGYSGAAIDPTDGAAWVTVSYVHEHCVWGIWVARIDLADGAKPGTWKPAASPAVPAGQPCPSVALSPYDGRPP